ncbi:DUF4914 family protein [Sulfuriroseicoccus oceanibius]|uniref:DUF4914 family protein n=1 Tax=Sulfuriroseicoccus oceanibius TaxID=2707525 RepID=A0A6B3L9F1_9BACT|nr:DUF4914 family protein [Sulfuriroseicoccus oceanibius]QQL45025.1 DUF4914 family protein [Sulfuriroseicoccus oceanibius]
MSNTTTASFDPSTLPYSIPKEAFDVLAAAPSVTVAESEEQLAELAVRDADAEGWHDVAYEVPGKGMVLEARACKVKNGISANYVEPYMRRRDPDCMVIGDKLPTDKPTFSERFGKEFDGMRDETFEWLKGQDLAIFPFQAGIHGKGVGALVIAPANAGFFAYGLALLQGMLPSNEVPEDFDVRAVIYVAPPFRHTHLDGKQVVVHNRTPGLHELFAYNLYPGPSAKKGIYGVLLNIGEEEKWITMHCSTVRVVTPYENSVVISHEGASGGGKSEMLEPVHREANNTLKVGTNIISGEQRFLSLPSSCSLSPVTDDMAACYPPEENGKGKLTVADAEAAWFVRVNHIDKYGVDPHLERLTVTPSKPLLFLNIDANPGSTALIWEHIEDEPGKPCPNPRVVVPRGTVPDIHPGKINVDIRSFGVRCPPCTKEDPTYGILGMFHLLPPALAWLWRLVAPRGHANPSIVDTGGMSSEGVGSYWPFATGRRVDQANLLLEQIMETPAVRYVLIPNQHVGSWNVGFIPQWITRELLARRGGANFKRSQLSESRCPLLGWTPKSILIEGRPLGSWFFTVEKQPEVGTEAYDKGAEILRDFFHQEIRQFLHEDLHPVGREIIETCLNGGSIEDYQKLIDHETLVSEEFE